MIEAVKQAEMLNDEMGGVSGVGGTDSSISLMETEYSGLNQESAPPTPPTPPENRVGGAGGATEKMPWEEGENEQP